MREKLKIYSRKLKKLRLALKEEKDRLSVEAATSGSKLKAKNNRKEIVILNMMLNAIKELEVKIAAFIGKHGSAEQLNALMISSPEKVNAFLDLVHQTKEIIKVIENFFDIRIKNEIMLAPYKIKPKEDELFINRRNAKETSEGLILSLGRGTRALADDLVASFDHLEKFIELEKPVKMIRVAPEVSNEMNPFDEMEMIIHELGAEIEGYRNSGNTVVSATIGVTEEIEKSKEPYHKEENIKDEIKVVNDNELGKNAIPSREFPRETMPLSHQINTIKPITKNMIEPSIKNANEKSKGLFDGFFSAITNKIKGYISNILKTWIHATETGFPRYSNSKIYAGLKPLPAVSKANNPDEVRVNNETTVSDAIKPKKESVGTLDRKDEFFFHPDEKVIAPPDAESAMDSICNMRKL